MRMTMFSTKSYDRASFGEVRHDHDVDFLEARLTPHTAALAAGSEAVCSFVNDDVGSDTLVRLADVGVALVVLRSAGFNHVDLATANDLGMTVLRVPAYSPYAVAEHTVALILTLNRKLHRSYGRVREGNFALDGLLGFDLNGRTVGVVGTGTIGTVLVRIMRGFGCEVLAHDPRPNDVVRDLGARYVELDDLFTGSQIISLHTPLTPETHHLIGARSLARMQDGTMLVNTSRGGLVDTAAVIEALKSGRLGSLGLDVYEEEADLFFEDLSDHIIRDDVFSRLLTFPNVVVTGHQAFFTEEALRHIASTTMANVDAVHRRHRRPGDGGHAASAPRQVTGASS